MPKLNSRNPKMGKLKSYAVVRYGGKIHYLGKHGTPEALAAYNRFCAELQSNPSCVIVQNEETSAMFNCNVLPRDVELTDGFFRRLLIIPFLVTIPEAEQIKDLAKQIIAKELSGVFNWVLTGLNRLLKNKRFTHSPIVDELVKQYRIESDSAAMFLQEKMIRPGTSKKLLLKNLYKEYAEFCKENGYHATSNITFSHRLRGLGFIAGRNEKGKC